MSNRVSKCGEVISMTTRSTISLRYHSITKVQFTRDYTG